MSRSADRAGRSRDGGFTLVEIIVALGILSVVLVALLPQLIVGIKATGTARLLSQAKGVSSGELERMRNLPFHIARSAGPFRDVLDNFYPDLVTGTSPVCRTGNTYTKPTVAWSGYVESGARCDYEPATGPFHRTVRLVPAAAGIAAFAVVTDVQFLSGDTPPVAVTPRTGYDTQNEEKDSPAASQIGVTVTVLYTESGVSKPVTTYTQIAEQQVSATRVRSEADVRVIDVGSVTSAAVPLTLSAGLLHLKGSVSFASEATASLTTVSAGLATGEQAGGAVTSASAPPSTITTATTGSAGALAALGCAYACWGATSVPPFSMAAEDALPLVGSSAAPAHALVTSLGNSGMSFGNEATSDYRPELALVPPLLRLDPSATAGPSGLSACGTGVTGPSSYLSASGYLTTTPDGASGLVEACAVARAAPVELFPTTFAPRGVVRITLNRASARCRVQGTSHAANKAFDYQALVQYWNGSGYSTAAIIDPSKTVDALDGINLSTTSVGGARKLGDYIESWSSVTPDEITQTARQGTSQLTVPGIVTIASHPMRENTGSLAAYESSMVSVTVGVLSCRADDAR